MDTNRPRSREKNVTGESGKVYKRGNGIGGGPLGGGRPSGGQSSNRNSGNRMGGGILSILIVIAMLIFGGGNIGSLFSSDGADLSQMTDILGYGNGISSTGSSYGTWIDGNNTGILNTEVASAAPEKRTILTGHDTMTLMVYMCGADLESRSGMATMDLQEMLAANTGDDVNIIVYTGGAANWKNSVISNRYNQIYQIKNGKLYSLVENAGSGSLTSPDTLSSFIRYADENFPANRRSLILWDHGGGSLSGYGYDEKKPGSGSMNLSNMNKALKKAGVTFDFIGFDACLMATVEKALTLDEYADYLIASEETEPGVGWYYTDWLKKLSDNPSMDTLHIGKNIIDDFVKTCDQKTPGQKTTLSLIDLAEASATIPKPLNAFSKTTMQKIKNDQYAQVSNARYQTREFAQSTKIDQVDLYHLAKNMHTSEGDALAKVVRDAVKYNRTSSNMTNAYGMSVYFPGRKISKVDEAVDTYQEIGMDEEYTRCIQAFASMEVAGQASSGAQNNPLSSLFSTPQQQPTNNVDAINQLLDALLSGNVEISGIDTTSLNFLNNRVLDTNQMSEYITDHQLDTTKLQWTDSSTPLLRLTKEQWELIQAIALNVYYDDGDGYINLGLDNVFQFDDEGNLIGTYDNTWLAVNNQPVAYYYESTIDDGENYTIRGYIPALLNGQKVKLIVVFDNEHPYGTIVGANTEYDTDTTETIAKNIVALQDGDTLDFLCDYYDYDGNYLDSYMLGEQMTVQGTLQLSNVNIGNHVSAMYRLTDIYNQNYWTDILPQ